MVMIILSLPEPKKVVFGVMSVCVSVCVSVYKAGDYTCSPIWIKFGMLVQFHGISRRFFHFFEFLIFKGSLPPKTLKKLKKSKLLKNGSNDFD